MSFIGNVTKAVSVHKRKLGVVGIIAGRLVSTLSFSQRFFNLIIPGLVGLQYAGLNPIGNIFRTPGVKQIEARYTSAGGSPTRQPASGTPLGKKDQVVGNTEKQQGYGTENFANTIQDQKPPVSEHPLLGPLGQNSP